MSAKQYGLVGFLYWGTLCATQSFWTAPKLWSIGLKVLGHHRLLRFPLLRRLLPAHGSAVDPENYSAQQCCPKSFLKSRSTSSLGCQPHDHLGPFSNQSGNWKVRCNRSGSWHAEVFLNQCHLLTSKCPCWCSGRQTGHGVHSGKAVGCHELPQRYLFPTMHKCCRHVWGNGAWNKF